MSKKIILGLLFALSLSACTDGLSTADETNSKSLLGVDADKNGIRDDVEVYINDRIISDTQKQAALFEAKVLQNILLADITNETALSDSNADMMAAIICMNSQFDDYEDAEALGVLLEEQTFNTEERAKAYDDYNKAQEEAGLIINIPSGDTCQTV